MLARRVMPVTGLTFAAAFTVAFALFGATTASARQARFVDGCFAGNSPVFMGNGMTRYAALAYAYHGVLEGYQWGGGCWNDNNVDDQPGDPPGQLGTGGEGGDCSGFVFKSWFESGSDSDGRFWWWHILKNLHGPYITDDFQNGRGAANDPYPKKSIIPMDALVSHPHMGLLLVPNGDGTDDMLEAKGEAYGTNVWTRTYRRSASYTGVRRTGWSG